jgi:hypothetical protein
MYIYIPVSFIGIYISTVNEGRADTFVAQVYMETFTLSDLGVFLGVVGGIVTSILLTIQKSKCKNIKCPWSLPDPKIESEEIRP